jgi:hypothetical protein
MSEISLEEERRILEADSALWIPVADAPKYLSGVDLWVAATPALLAKASGFQACRVADCRRIDGRWSWSNIPPDTTRAELAEADAMLNEGATHWRYPPTPPNFNWAEYIAEIEREEADQIAYEASQKRA